MGLKLLQQSERISKYYGYNKLAIISGVGVRNYYRKRGYKLVGSYMIKNLTDNFTSIYVLLFSILVYYLIVVYLFNYNIYPKNIDL